MSWGRVRRSPGMGRAVRVTVAAGALGAVVLGAAGCARSGSSPVATLPPAPGVVLEVAPSVVAPGARVTVMTVGGADSDVKGALASLRRNDVVVAWLLDERFGGPTLASPGRTVASPNLAFRLSQPQVFALPGRLEDGVYRLCTAVGPPGPVRTEACGDVTVRG